MTASRFFLVSLGLTFSSLILSTSAVQELERDVLLSPMPSGGLAPYLRHIPGGAESKTALRLHSAGADPWITQHEGLIYYTHTTGRDIRVWTGRSLAEITSSEPRIVWKPGHRERYCSQNVWAPELHRVGNHWYIYFAADDGRNRNHRMYVLESRQGPLGPYELKGKLTAFRQDLWAIDGTIVEFGEVLYFAWSGWPGRKNGRQNIYLSRMQNPWTLEGEPVLVSQPQFGWESWINEGPQFLKRGEKLFLVYSANRSWSDAYCLGLLELSGPDPLVSEAWSKSSRPVFQSVVHHKKSAAIAPGHNSFFWDAEGRSWIVYHVAKYRGSGWKREIRAQEWRWSDNGMPDFGAPKPLNYDSKLILPQTISVPAHTMDSALRL